MFKFIFCFCYVCYLISNKKRENIATPPGYIFVFGNEVLYKKLTEYFCRCKQYVNIGDIPNPNVPLKNVSTFRRKIFFRPVHRVVRTEEGVIKGNL